MNIGRGIGMTNRDGEVIYRIDGNDALIEMNEQWDAFAIRNKSPHLVQQNVMRCNLWTFIQDPETRHLHKTLVYRVRAKKKILNLPFRCDSPALRRFMEMDLLPLARGVVEFHCRTIKTEPRDAVALLVPGRPAGQDLIRMCSWCKKVDVGAGHWVEIEQAVASLRLFERDSLPHITHTMCDACLEDLGIASL